MIDVSLHYRCKAYMKKKRNMLQGPPLSSAERVAAERPGKFIFLTRHI